MKRTLIVCVLAALAGACGEATEQEQREGDHVGVVTNPSPEAAATFKGAKVMSAADVAALEKRPVRQPWEPVKGRISYNGGPLQEVTLTVAEWQGIRETMAAKWEGTWKPQSNADGTQLAQSNVTGYFFECLTGPYPLHGETMYFRHANWVGSCMVGGIFHDWAENTPGSYYNLGLWETGIIWGDVNPPESLNDRVSSWMIKAPTVRPMYHAFTRAGNGTGTTFSFTATAGALYGYANFHAEVFGGTDGCSWHGRQTL